MSDKQTDGWLKVLRPETNVEIYVITDKNKMSVERPCCVIAENNVIVEVSETLLTIGARSTLGTSMTAVLTEEQKIRIASALWPAVNQSDRRELSKD